ncbi:hypothetical protein CIB48_g2504 [Xylaria polymorpha]|nr:hypothetical protein CIB48_g2504 [Xylaria polymorpha]
MTLIDRDFPEIITRSGSLASPSVFSLKSRRGLFSEPQLLLKISNALGIAACAIPAQFFIRIPMTYGVDYTCPAKIEQSKLYNITDISAKCNSIPETWDQDSRLLAVSACVVREATIQLRVIGNELFTSQQKEHPFDCVALPETSFNIGVNPAACIMNMARVSQKPAGSRQSPDVVARNHHQAGETVLPWADDFVVLIAATSYAASQSRARAEEPTP